MSDGRVDPVRLAVAVAAAVALVLVAPFIGDIRDALRDALPGAYGQLINLVVGMAVLLALGVAVSQVRTHRAPRYLALVGALVVAAASSALTSTASSSVNAVERFHFVEYGLITWLFYRALLPRGTGRCADLSLLLIPALAALLVSTADELFQWVIPSRVGEWRDIFLNGTAIAAGMLVSLAAEPPHGLAPVLPRRGRRRVVLTATVFILALTGFLHVVHLGVMVVDGEAGAFRSRYEGGHLLKLAAERQAAWAERGPPMVAGRVTSDDKYLAEGVWHIRARNQAWEDGRIDDAWFENRILEIYYAPMLETGTYAAPASRWPAAQRDEARSRLDGTTATTFLSRAEPVPLMVMSPQVLWMSGLAVILAMLTIGLVPRTDSW